jgi:hypothetical protein
MQWCHRRNDSLILIPYVSFVNNYPLLCRQYRYKMRGNRFFFTPQQPNRLWGLPRVLSNRHTMYMKGNYWKYLKKWGMGLWADVSCLETVFNSWSREWMYSQIPRRCNLCLPKCKRFNVQPVPLSYCGEVVLWLIFRRLWLSPPARRRNGSVLLA